MYTWIWAMTGNLLAITDPRTFDVYSRLCQQLHLQEQIISCKHHADGQNPARYKVFWRRIAKVRLAKAHGSHDTIMFFLLTTDLKLVGHVRDAAPGKDFRSGSGIYKSENRLKSGCSAFLSIAVDLHETWSKQASGDRPSIWPAHRDLCLRLRNLYLMEPDIHSNLMLKLFGKNDLFELFPKLVDKYLNTWEHHKVHRNYQCKQTFRELHGDRRLYVYLRF